MVDSELGQSISPTSKGGLIKMGAPATQPASQPASRPIPFSCPPQLKDEGTIPSDEAQRPSGQRKVIFTTRADFYFDLTGEGSYWTQHDYSSGVPSFYLGPGRASSQRKKKGEPPVTSGIAYEYERLPKNLGEATHVEVMVKPKTRGYLILEIYDSDNLRVGVKEAKNPRNRYLPKKDVDLFKVRIPIIPTGRWQTLAVPLSRFIDWNRKRSSCDIRDPGVNEDIGDGTLNPSRRESFQFQVVLEAEDYGKTASAYIGQRVRFVRYDSDPQPSSTPIAPPPLLPNPFEVPKGTNRFSFKEFSVVTGVSSGGSSVVIFRAENDGIRIIHTPSGIVASATGVVGGTFISPSRVENWLEARFHNTMLKSKKPTEYRQEIAGEIKMIREYILPRHMSTRDRRHLQEVIKFLEGLIH